MLDKLLFGKNYYIYSVEEINNKIILHIKSKLHQYECPHCHQISNSYHPTYTRKIQNTSVHNTETWLHVSAYKYYCLNPECKCKTYVETLPFAKYSQVKTDVLISFTLGISIFLSNSSASLILSLIGVKVSADTIKNIYDNIIYKMLKNNLDYKVIYSYVKYKGYKDSEAALDNHIKFINENNFLNSPLQKLKFVNMKYSEDVIIIKRNQLLKYILTINPKTKKDDRITKNIQLLLQLNKYLMIFIL